jgi:Nif-specific regulatory protein
MKSGRIVSKPRNSSSGERHPVAEVTDCLSISLAECAAGETDAASFLQQALSVMLEVARVDCLAVLRAEKGTWRMLATCGEKHEPALELMGLAADGDGPVVYGSWWAMPFTQDGAQDLLVAFAADGITSPQCAELEYAAPLLVITLEQVRARQRDRQQVARLAAMLEIAADWTRTLEMDALLARMAQAATRLLAAERASIFLWDKPSRTVVGRPALGVNGGELRLSDEAGIIGQVLHSGQPRRVDADVAAEQREIDRTTDQRLKFHTRSIVCVPLRSRRGELLGAFEVLNKLGGNFTADDEQALTDLAAHAAAALENSQEWEHLASARRQVADQAEHGVQLVGECPAIAALRTAIERIARTDLSVLILGENGTGKEVAAHLVHYRSRRRQEPLIAVNCAAIPDTLLESELFGHEKGAFTDARQTRKGKFELAAGGTLLLDEIGDMSLAGQAKLLRVLEEKTIVRLGGSLPIAIEARLIAATNQNLAELVRARRFREDLFFRLNVAVVELPPLRERGEDVLLLAEFFLKRFATLARRRPPGFTAAARQRLLAHTWPGNVRELRNLMERLAYLAPEEQTTIDAADLVFLVSPTTAASSQPPADLTLAEATQQFQIGYIQRRIDRLRGNMTAVAQELGLHRSNLYRKMRQLGMDTRD